MESYTKVLGSVNAEVAAAEIPAFLPRRKQAAIAKPKPINIVYIRADDGAEMILIGPHQYASLDALLARRLAPSAIKAVGVE